MGKEIVLSSNLFLHRQDIFLCGDVLKGQRVMLIKWENFCAFFYPDFICGKTSSPRMS
jgi:hypothetical protein